jgi:hypothetical protein
MPDTERQVLPDLTPIWNLKRLISWTFRIEWWLLETEESRVKKGWGKIDQRVLRYYLIGQRSSALLLYGRVVIDNTNVLYNSKSKKDILNIFIIWK